MNWKAAVILAATALLIAQHDGRAGAPQAYAVYGPVIDSSVVSCARWNTAESHTREAYTWWVDGFVSGAGRELSARGVRLAQSDANGLHAWVTKYCSDHQLDSLLTAVTSLVDELKARAR